MNITSAINELEAIRAEHGDLEIIGGEGIFDDTPLGNFTVVDANGIALEDGGDTSRVEGVFLLAER